MRKIKNIFLEFYNDKKQIGFLFSIALLDYLTKDILTANIDVQQATMGVIAISAAVIGAGASIYAANKNAQIAGDAAAAAGTERGKQQARRIWYSWTSTSASKSRAVTNTTNISVYRTARSNEPKIKSTRRFKCSTNRTKS